MGTAKAALEHEVRQLAAEWGPQDVRVNAISAGPLDTLAARGIHGFLDMKRIHAEKAPLQRNINANEVAKTALFLCRRSFERDNGFGNSGGRRLPHHGCIAQEA